jgi:2-polyprenyl-3-methyl-5-hydroxy-6-metoxy-1,4-benzoquinol methylase
MQNDCRICQSEFYNLPLLSFNNMPKAAQFMPDADSLENDSGVNLEVCQCSGCGMVQLSNTPVPYYKEVVRASAYSEEMGQFRMKQFKEFVSKYALQSKKVIEIGCGRGEYLSFMQDAGADAYGLEYSENSVEECVANGLQVNLGFIEKTNVRLNNAPFDAFFIMSFLEHLPDPNTVLQGICNNLCDGGVGLVEVPNFDMIIKNKLFSEFIGDHLFYFTRDTLHNTLSRNGFEVVECDNVWHNYIISATVRKRKPLDLKTFRNAQNNIKRNLHEYIERFPEKKVAVWGAGHQSLAVIALAELQDMIRYVVDSAPFKQGKYTQATHIPIVSPRELETDPVEAVIIIAAAYSNEVLKIMQNDYANIKHVSVLEDKGLKVFY